MHTETPEKSPLTRVRDRRPSGWRIRVATAAICLLYAASFFYVTRHGSSRTVDPAEARGPEKAAENIDRPAPAAGGHAHENFDRSAPAAAGHAHNRAVPGDALLLGPDTTLLVVCATRPEYLRRVLDAVRRLHPAVAIDPAHALTVVVSQDGRHAGVAEVVREFVAWADGRGLSAHHLTHEKPAGNLRTSGYVLLARHFGRALGSIFDGSAYGAASAVPQTQRVIVLEDDIAIAPDFFAYFGRTAGLLDADPKLYAVSAFSDNGRPPHAVDKKRLLRSDFFPGLGWMMTRSLWEEFGEQGWAPNGYWDDWLREPDIRKGRQVIRPEVSRTFHFGEQGGVSGNIFGRYHNNIILNDLDVDWEREDISYLRREEYDARYLSRVESATLLDVKEAVRRAQSRAGGATEWYRIEYRSQREFTSIARRLGIMGDEKAGVPRTAYGGVVEARVLAGDGTTTTFIYVAPPTDELRRKFALDGVP